MSARQPVDAESDFPIGVHWVVVVRGSGNSWHLQFFDDPISLNDELTGVRIIYKTRSKPGWIFPVLGGDMCRAAGSPIPQRAPPCKPANSFCAKYYNLRMI